MKTIDKAKEKRLIGAIDKAISFTNDGMTPTDAITKVAGEEQLSPPFIHRMVEAFNKSKSMHRLKEASADTRHRPFSLADADKVLENIYGSGSMQKSASAGTAVGFNPSFSFGIDKMMRANIQKTAAAPVEETPKDPEHEARVLKVALYKQAHAVEGARKKLHDEVLQHKYAFEQSIERACEVLLPLSNRAFRKVAQVIVNGYPSTGDRLVKVLSQKTRKPAEGLQKTANAVVFPTKEPYLTIGKIYDCAEKLAAAENRCNTFEKEALNFLSSLSANALANLAAPGEERLGESLQGARKRKTLKTDEVLDPVFYNRLRELDARRALMKLVLHDPDLKNYKYEDIVNAYNSSVGSVPEASGNPVVLKTLVLRNLESSGIKDVVELAQEQQLSQSMAKTEKDRETVRQAQEMQDEEKPEQPTAKNIYTTGENLKARLGTGTTMEDRVRSISERAGQIRQAASDTEDRPRVSDSPYAGDEEDMEQWRKMAMDDVLKGGRHGSRGIPDILGAWHDGTTHSGYEPAASIEEVAEDLRDLYTNPPHLQNPRSRIRGKSQYLLQGF